MDDQPQKPPDCIYCAAHGQVSEAVFSFQMPFPDGDREVPLCIRHFHELRNTFNGVWEEAQRKVRTPLVLPPRMTMN